jgi:hypothetical protein
VTRDGAGFTAEYRLARDAEVWVFLRSGLQRESREPWRPSQWRVGTAGVVLDRVGDHDILRSEDGGPVPREVSIALSPASAGLEADYDPALIFSGGSVALFSGQFDVFPRENLEAAAALPADLNAAEGVPARATRACWADPAGPVLHKGERREAPCGREEQTYVLFGEAGLAETEALATVLDTDLPEWIADEIGGFAPQVVAFYEDRLGPALEGRPIVMASWNGPAPGMTSMGGSVLPGLIVMSFEGEGVVEPSDLLSGHARWFIAHEAAHFWLGQTVRYEYRRDAWITEGGADLAAVRALQALDPDWTGAPGFLQESADDCAALALAPVESAGERGEHRAYYACGTVFALAVEAALGEDWLSVLADMIERTRESGVLRRTDWLAALDDAPRGAEMAAIIERLLEDGSDDPAVDLAALMQAAGLAHRLEEGRLALDA